MLPNTPTRASITATGITEVTGAQHVNPCLGGYKRTDGCRGAANVLREK